MTLVADAAITVWLGMCSFFAIAINVFAGTMLILSGIIMFALLSDDLERTGG